MHVVLLSAPTWIEWCGVSIAFHYLMDSVDEEGDTSVEFRTGTYGSSTLDGAMFVHESSVTWVRPRSFRLSRVCSAIRYKGEKPSAEYSFAVLDFEMKRIAIETSVKNRGGDCLGAHTFALEATLRRLTSVQSDIAVPAVSAADALDSEVSRRRSSSGALVAGGSSGGPLHGSLNPWHALCECFDCEEAPLFYEQFEYVFYLHDGNILDRIMRCCENAHHLVRASCMTIDNVMTNALCHKFRSDTNAKDSFGVFVLLDLGNVEEPACARQHEAMLSMHKWGVKFRARKPNPCFASIHHDKAWLFDRHLIILGSANATHNSHNNCSESDIGTRDPNVIQQFESSIR